MIKIIALCACLFVFGCATPSPMKNNAETAKETISAMVNSLPSECRTENIINLQKVTEKQIDNIVISCETEKKGLNSTINYYKILSVLLGVVIVYLLKAKFF